MKRIVLMVMIFSGILFAAPPLIAQQSDQQGLSDDISTAVNISIHHITNDGLQGVGRGENQNVSRQEDSEGADAQSDDQDDQSDQGDDGSDSPNGRSMNINRKANTP
jgi:hypothetical protein